MSNALAEMRACTAREHQYLHTPNATVCKASTAIEASGDMPSQVENNGFRCRAIVSRERLQNVAVKGRGKEKNEVTCSIDGVGSRRSPFSKPKSTRSHCRAHPLDPRARRSGRKAARSRGYLPLVTITVISQRSQASEYCLKDFLWLLPMTLK